MTKTTTSGLSVQRLRQVLAYDAETGLFRWKARPSKCCRIGAMAGCKSPRGYILLQLDGTIYLAHRLAWLYVHGAWPTKDIDHINLDKSDNRLCNLRETDGFQNMANIRKHARNKSGVKGVHLCSQTGKWRANIQIRGVEKTLGRFDTIDAAADAYREAAVQAAGAFARTED